MRALSIQQPWAWLIVNRYKAIENRTWPARYRGEFLVHASKKLDRDSLETLRDLWPDIPFPRVFELGGIVGSARLVDCVQHSRDPWFAGPYGFVLADAKPLPFRPCRGQLGFFVVEGGA